MEHVVRPRVPDKRHFGRLGVGGPESSGNALEDLCLVHLFRRHLIKDNGVDLEIIQMIFPLAPIGFFWHVLKR